MKTIKHKISSVFRRLISMDGKPEKIAFSYAFGIFLATTPFVGMKALMALLITHLCKWKKGAAIIGVYHVNSLTGPFFYTFSFFIGKTVMGYDCRFTFPDHLDFQSILVCFAGSREIFLSLLIGGLIVGIPLSLLAYKLLLAVINKYRTLQKLQPA